MFTSASWWKWNKFLIKIIAGLIQGRLVQNLESTIASKLNKNWEVLCNDASWNYWNVLTYNLICVVLVWVVIDFRGASVAYLFSLLNFEIYKVSSPFKTAQCFVKLFFKSKKNWNHPVYLSFLYEGSKSQRLHVDNHIDWRYVQRWTNQKALQWNLELLLP